MMLQEHRTQASSQMILDSPVEVTGVTTNVTLHAGHDVAYFTRGQDAGGCAGAMSYYTAAGEPPGQWAGTAARKSLGLTGQVDAGVLDRLFMKGIGPDGEILAAKRQRKDAGEREEAAVAAYRAAHPYASAVEIAEVRAAERGKDPHTVPYFDLTVSAVKSVSVLHASYRTGARQARDRGDEEEAAALDAKAQEIEDALMRVGARSGRLAGSSTPPTPAPATTPPPRGSGATATAWPPRCSCITSAATETRSCTSTSRSGTGSSAPTGPTTNGAPWTPGRCTTSGSPSPPPPTG